MFVLLALAFLLVPIAEIYLIVQVAGGIGVPETILLLIAISALGAWLTKIAGVSVLYRLQRTVRAGRVPSAEIVDGALVLLAGALMITPGFLSDALAIVLLLPPTRAVIRRLVLHRIRDRGGFFNLVTSTPWGPTLRRGRGLGRRELGRPTGATGPQPMTPAVPTRDGATVMLVRDGHLDDRPLEVFMLRRHPSTAFGSVHVFPGGVVDATDHAPELDDLCPGLTDQEASERLGVASGGRAYWVAAVREAFEEAGVLLARRVDGEAVRFDGHEDVQRRFDQHRRAVHAGERSLVEVLAAEHLVLALDGVRYVAHWITPEGEPKRFDTRFFLARAPEGQAYAHDDAELIGSEWVRPPDALARHQAGDFPMIGPTIVSLQDIGRFATCDELLASENLVRAAGSTGPA